MDILVKQSHEYIWHFTHSEDNGICFSRFNNSCAKEYDILLSDGRGDFDVVIDDENVLHMVCRDSGGNIIYLTYESGAWHKHVLLSSKTQADYDKNFRLVRISGWLNLFYTIEYHGKTMLSHQIIGGAEPAALDYTDGGGYKVTSDLENNIWIFYRREGGCFGYRKYIWSRKKWDPFMPLSEAEELEDFYPYTDNKLNFAGVRDGEIYACGSVIGRGEKPVLCAENNVYWCMWNDNGRIQAMRSNDRGATWRSSGEFITGMRTEPMMFRIAYTSYEQGLDAENCYGYINGNIIRLYVLNRFMQVQTLPPPKRERIAGSEVEQFAQSFPEYAGRMNGTLFDAQPVEIRPQRSNRQEAEDGRQVQKQNDLADRIEAIEKRLEKLEQREQEIKKEPSSDSSGKKHLWFF